MKKFITGDGNESSWDGYSSEIRQRMSNPIEPVEPMCPQCGEDCGGPCSDCGSYVLCAGEAHDDLCIFVLMHEDTEVSFDE